jgi:hypothetical protein
LCGGHTQGMGDALEAGLQLLSALFGEVVMALEPGLPLRNEPPRVRSRGQKTLLGKTVNR